MEYGFLGNTGLQVSDMCLGTMQFLWTTDEPNSFAVLNAFVEAGGNFVDTADVYSRWADGCKGGEAETVIGKYRRNQPPPDSKRFGSVQKVLSDRNFDLLDKIEEIARSRNKTAAQISLGWILAKPNVAAPIIGANNVEQLKDSLGATGLKLNEEEMSVLDKMSEWKSQ